MADQAVGDEANYYDVLGDGDGVISEHECLGDPKPTLNVTILDMGLGAQLICEIPDTDSDDLTYTITAPNKCLLLCEYHLAMVIEGRLSEEGEYNFYIGDTYDVVTVDVIKCW